MTNHTPKVSIILPSLNVVEYIEECLNSVCKQSLKEIEIICVDAGSTDGTLEKIQKFALNDERIKILIADKKSYGYQMNLGIDNSKGKYVGIVETDDYVSESMYEDLYNIAEANGVDFVKADFYRFNHNESGEEVLYLNKLSDNSDYYNRIINPRKEKSVFKFTMNTWSGIYNREFLIKHNIRHNETPGASYQDTDFWFQTFSLAERVYFVDKPYYKNRRDNPNSSVYNNKKIYAFCDEYEYIYSILFKNKQNNDLLPEFQLYRYRSYMSSLNKCEGDDKRKFVQRFKEDLLLSKERGELDLSLFTEGGRKTINLILNDTEKIVIQQIKKKPVSYKLGTNSKEVVIASRIEGAPKVSVIIPLYNAEKYIEHCLKSILNQTLREIEVIVINDGSTDSSVDKVKEFCKNEKRITILSQPNQGSGKARNFGLTFAKGEYIAFMDSDDWYPTKDILDILYKKGKENQAKICGGSFSNSRNGIVTTKFSGNYKKYTFECEGFVDFSDYQFDYGYHRFIYARELIKENEIEFPDLLRFQDPPFFLKCMQAAGRFYAIPKVVYCYRKGENIVKWNVKKIKDLLEGILFEVEFSRKNNYVKLHRIAVDHINVEFDKYVREFANFKNVKILELLFAINRALSVDMLIESGYKLDKDKDYIIKPLRRFADTVNEDVLSVTINTKSRNITIDNLKNSCIYAQCDSQSEAIKKDYKILQNKLDNLRNGASYKIGRLITFIPRMMLKYMR